MKFIELLSERNPRVRKWWARLGPHSASIALVLGFVWDYFLFQRPDRPLENILIGGHLALAAFGVILLNLRGREAVLARIPLILLIQFNFGALAKSLLVLYAKSGTWEGSAIFFIIFGLFVIGNEFAHDRYEETHFHLSAIFFMTLLYAALIVPVVLERTGMFIFFVSVIVAGGVMSAFVALLRFTMPRSMKGRLSNVVLWLGAIAVLFVSLYLLHLMPPVPLSMTQGGMYHSIKRVGNEYQVTFEKPPWYQFWKDTSSVYHLGANDTVSCFSSVYVPHGIAAPLVHVWQRYDESAHEWKTERRVSFSITSGRDEGYRGYSTKSSLTQGLWRCSVETDRGERLGIIEFSVVSGTSTLVASTL